VVVGLTLTLGYALMMNSLDAGSSDLEQKYAFNTTRPNGFLGSFWKACKPAWE